VKRIADKGDNYGSDGKQSEHAVVRDCQEPFPVVIALATNLAERFMIANSQRRQQDLTVKRKEVKPVSRLLPFCSSRKRIRDKKGGWMPI